MDDSGHSYGVTEQAFTDEKAMRVIKISGEDQPFEEKRKNIGISMHTQVSGY